MGTSETPSCCAASDVILRLSIPQLIVFSALVAEQSVMRAALDYAAGIKDRNAVTETAGSKTVADKDCRFIPGDVVET